MIHQFDVVPNPTVTNRKSVPYVAVLQSHLLRRTDTVLVAPLIRPDIVAPDQGTSLSVKVGEEVFTLDLGLLVSLRRSNLGRQVGTLALYDYEIRRGLDRLLTGF